MQSRVFVAFGQPAEEVQNAGASDLQIHVNIQCQDELVSAVQRKLQSREGFAIATLNIDHLYKLRADPSFAAAYRRHDIVTADGFPVVLIGRLSGRRVDRVTGADIIRPLAAWAAEQHWPIALVGATRDSLSRASAELMREFPGLQVVMVESPPMGFDPESDQAKLLLTRIRKSGARICFLAFGAPKQEIFAARGRMLAPQTGFISVGAGLDFISGAQVRAPLFLRKFWLEWLWRLVHDPKRMAMRYLKSVAVLPFIAVYSIASARFRISS